MRVSQGNSTQQERDNKKRDVKCKRVHKINYDSEKHYSIYIQEAAAEYKTSAKNACGTWGYKLGGTQQLKQKEKSVPLCTEENILCTRLGSSTYKILPLN